MKKTLLLAVTMCGVLCANATIFQYTVTMSGPNEFPVNASPATGTGTINYDNVAHTLQMQVTYSGLLAGVTQTHIHSATTAPFFQNASIAVGNTSLPGFTLGAQSGSYSNTLDLTQAAIYNTTYLNTTAGGSVTTAEALLAASMANSTAYWNIHTASPNGFPGGEIRGFTVAIPEPSSLALMGLGIAALAVRASRKGRGKL